MSYTESKNESPIQLKHGSLNLNTPLNITEDKHLQSFQSDQTATNNPTKITILNPNQITQKPNIRLTHITDKTGQNHNKLSKVIGQT